MVYTVRALPVRVNERMPSAWPERNTLDGSAFMETGIYFWPDEDHPIYLRYDHQAIQWLWENVQGTPVLLEAPIGYYREGGLRVSSFTGLPTLLGFHQSEQRPWEQVAPREGDAERIYTTTDLGELDELLRRYHVRYIYVGQLERYLYGGPGLTKFERLADDGALARVYHNELVDIYRVPADEPLAQRDAPHSAVTRAALGGLGADVDQGDHHPCSIS
jgi:hypothetical protein